MNTHAHPWKLRLVHHGFSHVDVAWEGGQIHFNPLQPVDSGDLVVLISTWPEAVQGVQAMLNNRQWCTIIAPMEVTDWLASLGWPREQLQTSFEKDGLLINLEKITALAEMR